ncbi:MAG: cysteine synthase family protein [Spirochaetaceae bacterium]
MLTMEQTELKIQKAIYGISNLIGNTPLLEITFKYKGELRKIFAKAENYNLTGSIKDRMAMHILKKAYYSGAIKPGDRIIEATSGNTGIAFSAIGRFLGHPVTIFMPDWMSKERINLIKSYGADIVLVSKEQGGFRGSIEMANKMAEELGDAFRPQQFDNLDNSDAHYSTTGPEISKQLEAQSMVPDAFVAGVGTGGTVMGVGKYLKEQNNNIKIYPLEPSNSPTLTTGHKVGSHRIQGISDEFIPSIVELDKLDDIICVDDGDAVIMAQKLAFNLGLGVGISSGANFIGALIAGEKLGSNKIVTTVFSDDNKKYLSTDLAGTEPVKEGFYSTDIELLSVNSLHRVCEICNKGNKAS